MTPLGRRRIRRDGRTRESVAFKLVSCARCQREDLLVPGDVGKAYCWRCTQRGLLFPNEPKKE